MARDRAHTLRRLYMAAIPEPGSVAPLDPDVRRHVDVLRLAEGDEVRLFDGRGTEAIATLRGEGALVKERVSVSEGPALILVQGLPKGGKADDIVRMATELGASAIHFATTERSVPKLDASRADKRVARWTKIAREAARQSERATIPAVLGPAPLAQVIERAPAGQTKLVAWARGGSPHVEAAGETWVAVGPEGGFTEQELELLETAGWKRLSLGPHVLRVDTAAAAALTILGRRVADPGEGL